MSPKVVTGKRQHIVPQQMIRNFAGDDGKLIEMVKPELRIGTRRRAPSGILFRDDFYRDRVMDFDAELLTPVEQKFATVYPEILEGKCLDGDQGAAFVCWVAAMLVRTRLISAIMPGGVTDLPETLAKHTAAANFDEFKRLLVNVARTQYYEMYLALLCRSGWKWKFRRSDPAEDDLILTDHPVCITSVHQQGGQLVFVPMSRRVAMLGGAPAALEEVRNAGIAHFNFFLIAYAGRHIFAAEKVTLESAVSLLSDESPFPKEYVEAGRQPLFGAPERMRQRMRDNPMPEGFDFGGDIQRHIESFGPPRWETDEKPEDLEARRVKADGSIGR